MQKVWHPYTAWECFTLGMWNFAESKDRNALLREAIKFTGNAELYGSWMMKVIVAWPVSCEHHLTDDSSNRRAYIGHAAACLAIQCPEDITRKAWGFLSRYQQDEANHKADLAIAEWERIYERR
ncbi:MAG: hypothetical protein ACXWQO_07935 [Bdellovibrionota bacterium]